MLLSLLLYYTVNSLTHGINKINMFIIILEARDVLELNEYFSGKIWWSIKLEHLWDVKGQWTDEQKPNMDCFVSIQVPHVLCQRSDKENNLSITYCRIIVSYCEGRISWSFSRKINGSSLKSVFKFSNRLFSYPKQHLAERKLNSIWYYPLAKAKDSQNKNNW